MGAQATQFHMKVHIIVGKAVFLYVDLVSESCAMPQLHVIERPELLYVKNVF